MSAESCPRFSVAALRDAGRQPVLPFRVALTDGSEVVVRRLLRVLPGKRLVGEGEWNSRRVLVKLFVASSSQRHWTQEKIGLEALHRAGIPTPELWLAAALPAGGHILLTRFLDDAQSLAQDWASLATPTAGSAAALVVLRPAFRILGALHASGLVQKDLHLGNFLRCADRVFAIDGDAVRVLTPGQQLSESQATDNLAVLLAQLPTAWDAHQETLLAAYTDGGGRVGDSRRLAHEVSRVRRWRLNEFLGKTLRECTLFAVQHGTFRFAVAQRERLDHLRPLLEAPDDAILQGMLLKDGKTCTVAQVDLDDRSVVVKRYNLKNGLHALGRLWRPSRALHSWREGHRLSFLGIATPAPLALIEERVGPLRRRAFLINEYCPGISLQKLLVSDREPEAGIAQAILSLFQDLQALRISHGDLKASNLLWHENRIVVIDLDALIQHRTDDGHARAWRKDRARLLRNWPVASVLHQWLDKNLIAAKA